jgi:hypothetical protein
VALKVFGRALPCRHDESQSCSVNDCVVLVELGLLVSPLCWLRAKMSKEGSIEEGIPLNLERPARMNQTDTVRRTPYCKLAARGQSPSHSAPSPKTRPDEDPDPRLDSSDTIDDLDSTSLAPPFHYCKYCKLCDSSDSTILYLTFRVKSSDNSNAEMEGSIAGQYSSRQMPI